MTKAIEELAALVNKTCVPLCTELVQQQRLPIVLAEEFYKGFTAYIQTGKTPKAAYLAARQIYHASEGRFPLYTKAIYNKLFPLDIHPSQCISEHEVAHEIAENGYAILDGYLANDESINEAQLILENKAEGMEAFPGRVKCSLEQDAAASLSIFSNIMKDKYLNNIIRLYLGSPPLVDIVSAWRLLPCKSFTTEDLSNNALQYHLDLDRFNFLKLFVYLSDVNENAGPHCYVPKTHLANMPRAIKEDRRYSDSEIHEMGLAGVHITGRPGTVILGDTHCLHKGSIPIDKHRDMFQIEFTLSMFGAPYHEDVARFNTFPLRDTLCARK